jgi:hypothetical protein
MIVPIFPSSGSLRLAANSKNYSLDQLVGDWSKLSTKNVRQKLHSASNLPPARFTATASPKGLDPAFVVAIGVSLHFDQKRY